jgi:hypothetical protein
MSPVTEVAIISSSNSTCKPVMGSGPMCGPGPCNSSLVGYAWGWLGSLIIWFVIFTVLFWLMYYSLKPSFVLQEDLTQVDTAKVLVAAVLSSLVIVVIVWLLKMAIPFWC